MVWWKQPTANTGWNSMNGGKKTNIDNYWVMNVAEHRIHTEQRILAYFNSIAIFLLLIKLYGVI
jgi:hypothetical protein